ncbi:hypothetical protein BaRGS_00018890 [Batillaria attramentaria]|uniref:Uncharacterized protein n=1 Tax=Batillaria attramentaria TaxID=370345 RepID=A0ABD0KSC8_9CAEN
MPIPGLPLAAEIALTSLLADHELTAWEVSGKGENSVVVFRFSSRQNGAQAAIIPGSRRKTSAGQSRCGGDSRRRQPGRRRRVTDQVDLHCRFSLTSNCLFISAVGSGRSILTGHSSAFARKLQQIDKYWVSPL